MFQLIEYLPEHAIEIMKTGGKQPGVVLNDESIAFANDVVKSGPCITGTFNDKVVGVGGVHLIWGGFGEAWALYRQDIGDYHINPAIAKKWLIDQTHHHKLFRLQAPLKSDFPEGELYTQWLGLKFEYRVPCYHQDGSDALMHSLINKDYLPERT